MVRLQKTRFNAEEERLLSILATISRHFKRAPLFRFIGRFRRGGKDALHKFNIKTVKPHAKRYGLGGLVKKCESLLS